MLKIQHSGNTNHRRQPLRRPRRLRPAPDVGIRWLSGKERLNIMGFAADWMRPTLQKLGLLETPLYLKLHNG